MILRSLMVNTVVDYFESEDWKELIKQMARGKEVRHAHIYADSILHPQPLVRVIEEYFRAHKMPLIRKPYVIAPGGQFGMTDIHHIHPSQDMGHCELILRYSKDQILAPMAERAASTGKTVEVWDDAYMEKHCAKYNFKTKLTNQDEKDLSSYFDSPAWHLHYIFMLGGQNRHSHALVETSIHPEILQKFAIEAIEAKGWEVCKSVSIAYTWQGFEFGKITILVSKPEIMLELEWDYNPNVSIKPGAEPIILMQTRETLVECMSGLDYIELDEGAVQEIIERLKAKA